MCCPSTHSVFWFFWQDTLSLHICNSIFGNYRQRKTSNYFVHVDANDTIVNLLVFMFKKVKIWLYYNYLRRWNIAIVLLKIPSCRLVGGTVWETWVSIYLLLWKSKMSKWNGFEMICTTQGKETFSEQKIQTKHFIWNFFGQKT
jgi:hypothetical protein